MFHLGSIHVKSNIIIALAAAILFMCSAVAVNAQDNTNQNQQPPAQQHMRAENNHNNETATGCLQQNSNGSGYTLTAQDGSTLQLTSNAMNLGTYVGKEVYVAGTESGSRGGHISRVSTSRQENERPMDVLDLAVVHERCQR